MQIAIIGAGNVGRALGTVWHKAGHEIVWHLRDPGASKDADLPGEKVPVGEGLRRADVTVLTVPWGKVDEVCASIGADFGGVLIDCTNPVAEDFSGLDRHGHDSGTAYLRTLLPKARMVKAFNQTGADNMRDADYGQQQPVSFICSSDEAAASAVRQLSEDLGFDSIVLRGIEHARQLEEMAWLWITLAVKQGHGGEFAFALARRPGR